MNRFVEECRREWKRLGVPRSTTDEMSAELVADLGEGSVEDVLGRDAADARSFARAWALERGVARRRRGSRLAAAVAALALVPTVVGAVLTIDAARPEPSPIPLVRIPPAFAFPAPVPAPPAIRDHLLIAHVAAARESQRTVQSLAQERVRLVAGESSSTLGIALLVVGLALLAPAMLFLLARGAFDG